MTMLEKAARALSVRRGWDWELCAPVTRNELAEDARAVLMAVKDVDADAVSLASVALAKEHAKPMTNRSWTSQYTAMSTRKAFVAMIDAILAEDTEPKT